jgi:hypothetical protein
MVAASRKSGARKGATPAPHHILQLFDAPRSLADSVSRYLIDGRARGESLLVVARASHWELIRAYLERRGFDADDTSGQLTVLDARKTRSRMMRRGVLDPTRLADTLNGIVSELSSATPLRVYGEIVELFAEEGDFDQACALEGYWNSLQQKHRFMLFCGYSAAHFADPRNAHQLRRVCGLHNTVQAQSADALGSWLTSIH